VSEPEITVPGAEPQFHDGGPAGALVLHGFTGNPVTMQPVTDAFVAAGFTVSMPRLPGHGTTVEDMLTTGWADWSAEAERAYQELAAKTQHVVVVGLSMGGTLTAWLAAHHPEIAGIVLINAAVKPYDPDAREFIQAMIDAGDVIAPGIGADLADPDAHEPAYEGSPLPSLLTMFDAVEDLQARFGDITCPALVMQAPQDHVVDPTSAEHVAALLGGPVERVSLDRSYHVATLDYDKALIQERAVEFANKVTAS
jgi:carboxylesterase